MTDSVSSVQQISVDEALDYILRHVAPLDSQPVRITEALGRVLAEDVVSQVDIPPFANSAMDGYAVRSNDVAGAGPESPAVLSVVAEVAAGSNLTTPSAASAGLAWA